MSQSESRSQSHKSIGCGASGVGDVRGASSRASSGSSRATILRLAQKPFGFDAKTSYDATEGLFRSRSEAFLYKPAPPDPSIWKRGAPNFTPKGFEPKPPKRNTRDSVKPQQYQEQGRNYIITRADAQPENDEKERNVPRILRPRRAKTAGLLTRFRPLTPGSDRQRVLRDRGTDEPYTDPAPTDFRQYPALSKLGLPEFETAHDKDPYNLNFLSERLNVFKGNIYLGSTRHTSGMQIGDVLVERPPTFVKQSYLPRDPWPLRPAQFSRHRAPMGRVHSAFMTRVERELTARWAREKMEQSLQQAANATHG